MSSRIAGAAAIAALAGLLVAPSVASATVDLTAVRIRIGDHPAMTRVVVDLVDGTLADAQVEARDPAPLDGHARVRITATRVRTEAGRRSGYGLTAGLVQGHGHIDLALLARPGRFKFLSYEVIPGISPRLVVDAWKSAPPTAAATILRAPGGCLALSRVTVSPGRVGVRGTEHGLFEHQFTVGLRLASGRVLIASHVTSPLGRWARSLPVAVTRAQDATLEAYDLTAKDGALGCIVQRRVHLIPA